MNVSMSDVLPRLTSSLLESGFSEEYAQEIRDAIAAHAHRPAVELATLAAVIVVAAYFQAQIELAAPAHTAALFAAGEYLGRFVDAETA